jgi:hypothetical protein
LQTIATFTKTLSSWYCWVIATRESLLATCWVTLAQTVTLSI